MRSLWRAYLVLGGLALAAWLALPGGRADGVAYHAISFLGLAGLVAGVLGHRPDRRAGWWLLAVGYGCFALGDLLFSWHDVILEVSPTGTVADVCYVLGYPFVAVGLVLMVRTSRSSGGGPAGTNLPPLIDVGVLTVGVCLVGWVVVIEPALELSTQPFMVKALAVLYPVVDVPVLAVVLRMLLGRARRAPAFWFLLCSLVTMTAADVLFALPSLSPSHEMLLATDKPLADLYFAASWLLIGLAGLHPSMVALSQPGYHRPTPVTGPRRFALAVASLAGPFTMLLEALWARTWTMVMLAVGASAIGLLVLARLLLLVRTAERAQTDRRRLLERLIHVAEAERTRIALEIHDGPLQVLAQVNLELERVQRMLARGQNERGRVVLAAAQGRLSDEIRGLRRLMVSLRPPALDEVGLEAALRDWLAQFQRRTGVRCELVADTGRLDPALETTIYRAVQEALADATTNIGATGATAVKVVLRGGDGWVDLEVHDDGSRTTGLDRGDSVTNALEASGIWLAGVRERIELAGGVWTAGDDPNGPRVAAHFDFPAPSTGPATDQWLAAGRADTPTRDATARTWAGPDEAAVPSVSGNGESGAPRASGASGANGSGRSAAGDGLRSAVSAGQPVDPAP